MIDLIDRQALKQEIKSHPRIAIHKDDIQRIIDEAPTVYAEPIIWHKVTTRPLTDEEKEDYAEDGIEFMFDCKMPDDGEEILIATRWGTDKDICSNDVDYGCGLEGYGDWDGVLAWAEMPKYRGENDE